MEVKSPRIRSLLRQARSVADSGKRAAAEKLYQQIVTEAPDVAEAWVGLGDVLRDEAAREAAYKQALVLDPENAAAQDGLAQLNEAGPADVPDRPPLNPSAFDQARSWLDEETARKRFDILNPPGRERQDPSASDDGTFPQRQSPVDPEPASATPPAPAGPAESDLGALDDIDLQLYCYRHPDRATSLRCISCGKPICGRCAVHTPVGYRCPVCIKEAQDVFYQATGIDYFLAALVSLPLAVLAGLFVPRLGFFVIFVGAGTGTLLGGIVRRIIGRRRGRYIPHLVATILALGGLAPGPILLWWATGSLGLLGIGIWTLVYVVLAASSAFYQLR